MKVKVTMIVSMSDKFDKGPGTPKHLNKVIETYINNALAIASAVRQLTNAFGNISEVDVFKTEALK